MHARTHTRTNKWTNTQCQTAQTGRRWPHKCETKPYRQTRCCSIWSTTKDVIYKESHLLLHIPVTPDHSWMCLPYNLTVPGVLVLLRSCVKGFIKWICYIYFLHNAILLLLQYPFSTVGRVPLSVLIWSSSKVITLGGSTQILKPSPCSLAQWMRFLLLCLQLFSFLYFNQMWLHTDLLPLKWFN